ncbi:Beta-barrel assembly machine subunit BamE [Luteibacter rhizovicinus]|uniref:Beta-barrel assembly machine subunit BamE n=1 Tax=Luteibacter rhizovicinus TaxID=242606 RepID=A0A4R3Z1V6_9GAMM|nr:OmpA family protein [Luteibacter rhizovicinus]TCV97783.1 Beta-barrel assembly machine subunit BamE [Luteibacter rhizovicinus]
MNAIQGINNMRLSLKGISLVSLALALAACGNISRDVAKDGRSSGELVWPATNDTTPMHKGGTFPNLANLRQVRAGLDKRQLSDLIGYPHFSEGVWGVREWNYVFNFRKPGSDEVTVCQYKVLFDDDKLARSFYWKPESCAALLAEPAPVESAAAVPAPTRSIVLSADALFAFDKSSLTPAGRRSLDELATELRDQGNKWRAVRIVGYTDRLGSEAYNQKLSQRRADAVMNYLVAQGVPAGRIRAEGHGALDPVKDCPDGPHTQLIACLAPNRRVEVKIDSGN